MKNLLAIILLFSFKLFGQKEECTYYSDSSGHKIYTSISKEAKYPRFDRVFEFNFPISL